MATYTSSIKFVGIDEVSVIAYKISKSLDRLTDNFSKNHKAISKTNVVSDNLNSTYNKLTGSTSKLSKETNELANKNKKASDSFELLKKASQGISSVGRTGMKFLTAPLTLFGAGALKASADFERLRMNFQALLGGAEKGNALFSKLEEMADHTVFRIDQMAESSRTLLAVGTTAGEIPEILTRMGNISAGAGKPLQQIVRLYAKIRDSGRVTGLEMRQFRNAGIGMNEELAKVLGVAKKDVPKLVKAGKVTFEVFDNALKNMTRGGEKFHDFMTKQSKTLWGALNIAGDRMKTFLSRIGDDIVRTFKLDEKLQDFSDWLKDLRHKWEALSKEEKKSLIFKGVAIAGLPIALKFLGDILTKVSIIAIAWKTVWIPLLSKIGIVGFGGIALALAKVAFIITGITLLIKTLVDHGNAIVQWWKDVFTDPLLAIESIIGSVEIGIRKLLNFFGAGLDEANTLTSDIFSTMRDIDAEIRYSTSVDDSAMNREMMMRQLDIGDSVLSKSETLDVNINVSGDVKELETKRTSGVKKPVVNSNQLSGAF